MSWLGALTGRSAAASGKSGWFQDQAAGQPRGALAASKRDKRLVGNAEGGQYKLWRRLGRHR